MKKTFIHLNIHSDYSIVDGIVTIDSKVRKNLVNKVVENQMPAVALTDQSNIYALVKHYTRCLANGIKPLLGAELWVNHSLAETPFQMIALCKDNQGYLNLKQMISISYLSGQQRNPLKTGADYIAVVNMDDLQQHCEGLIVLLGKVSLLGPLLLQDKQIQAKQFIGDFIKLFPQHLYIEIQRTNRIDDERFLHLANAFAKQFQLPLVATNAVRFLEEKDFMNHETRVCVSLGNVLADKSRAKNYSPQQYFRNSEEMIELFKDIPSAIDNTLEIAKRCNVHIELGKNYLPEFPIPDGMNINDYFRQLSHQGLEQRFKILLPTETENLAQEKQKYIERLNIELDVIINMGFPGYFLIVADFIRWSKENQVPVGPGRGSGAGSLVAYALLITDLDPLKYDLLFERFLNPERISMPDFDIDFCTDGRDKVIAYVADTYGKDRVSQIITYGKMAAKAAIRDVGRVQGLPYGLVDSVAKLIPMDPGITIQKSMEQEEELQKRFDEDETVHDLLEMALALEGTIRNVGKHAGGVVISPNDINEFAPVYCEADGSNLVTQFDKSDVEAVGLVKFDFLGLKTLTIIDWAVKIINDQKQQKNETLVDINVIPLDDNNAFEVLKKSDTTAIFQLESRGMKDLIDRLQPDCFEDIIALVALFRPGPLQSGMDIDFINRKHGREKVVFPHPSLETVLSPTYGTILYQEQVMQISQVLAGYSLGEADLLRRAMGKKDAKIMADQRSTFEDGAVKNHVDKEVATHIFDQMEKFAAYGFNKSHSAAYALVSYQTLWLKTYYRAPFMAAVLSGDMDKTEKIVMVIEECRDAGITVTVPDVNISCYRFTVTMEQTIVFGLGAIKGVGEGAIDSIEKQRKEKPYKDFQDFCNRVDLRKANKRVLETLVRAGALDKLGRNRASMMAAIPEAIKVSEQCASASASGQADLFGDDLFLMDSDENKPQISLFKEYEEWPKKQKLQFEKDTLGLYLSDHPIDDYLPELEQIITHRIKDIDPEKKQRFLICGLLIAKRISTLKSGSKMMSFIIDDRSARQDLVLFEEDYKKYQDVLELDSILVIKGEFSFNKYTERTRVKIESILSMDDARNAYAKNLQLHISQQQIQAGVIDHLKNLLLSAQQEKGCKVIINYQNDDAYCKAILADNWHVQLSSELLASLEKLSDKVFICYQ